MMGGVNNCYAARVILKVDLRRLKGHRLTGWIS